MEVNPGGLAADFKKYFDGLSKDDLKVSLLFNQRMYISDIVTFIRGRKRKKRLQ
jgi:hypothetical protein